MTLFPQMLLDVHDELIVDLFAGGGGASVGIEMAFGRSPDIAINHDAAAVAMHEANHPQTKHHVCDVFEADPRVVTNNRPVGLLWASPDCFPAGTLILTDRGYQPVESIRVGDSVLTHRGRYRRVTETMEANRPLVTVRGQGHPGLKVSPEHPFLTRQAHNVWNNAARRYDRTLSVPEWTKARDLRTSGAPMNAAGGDLSFWATPGEFPSLPVPEVGGRHIDLNEDLMWLAGRYVGDGWTRLTDTRAELVITCGQHEADGLRPLLDRWPRLGARAGDDELAWHERETGTAYQFTTSHRGLVEWLRSEFGHGAEHKSVPAWLLGLPESLRRSFLDGYLSADGHTRRISSGEVTGIQTVSKALAFGIRSIAESLGWSANVHGPYPNRSRIEGRDVNARPIWGVRWRHELQRSQTVREDGHNWLRIQSVEDAGTEETVYNLSVEEDESYVAEGVVVHNCTHFSKAKGGKPIRKKGERSRALAWVIKRWAGQVRPRVICMENVEEFVEWGPLIGPPGERQPDPRRKGERYRKFVRDLEAMGYQVERKEIRACDLSAPTIRNRLYIVARCDGRPIVWPEPTHGPSRRLKPYRTAAECIDWSIPMLSIFATSEEAKKWSRAQRKAGWNIGTPKRPLADNTLRRIARGVMRFVVESADPFVINLAQRGPREYPISEPLRTQHAGGNAFALVAPTLIQSGYGEREGQAPRSLDLHQPLGTVVGGGAKHALVAAFMAKHFTGVDGAPVTQPAPTVTTIDHNGLVAASLMKLRGTSSDADPRDPLHTVSAGGTHHGLVAAFLQTYYGQGDGQGLGDSMRTITTKDRLSLVTVVVDGWTYIITDILIRMLWPRELFNAQGFPPSYIIDRGADGRRLTKTQQVRMVGNSVSPPVAEALARANAPELIARDEVRRAS